MCYPEADEPHEKFLESLEQFKKDLHQVLVYSKGMNEKYIKVHENETTTSLWIYYQRKSLNILKVVVDADTSVDKYNLDPVCIFGEDDKVVATITDLDSVAQIRKYMGEVREIVYQDQVVATLKYGNLLSDTSSN